MKKSLFLAIALLIISVPAMAADVTLQWNAVDEADWYRAFRGHESRKYIADSGQIEETTHTFNGL